MSKKPHITSWSLSRLQKYEQCPRQYYKELIEKKIKVEPSYALINGIRIHNLMEQYLLGNIPNVPPDLAKFTNELHNMRQRGAIPEEKLVLDSEWQWVEDGWSTKQAWLRGKSDARIDDFIVDLKTGKHYDEHEDQAALYSVCIFKKYPEFDSIDVEFWHSKSGDVHDYTFKAVDVPDIIDYFKPRVEKLFKEKEWKPTAMQWCKYCPFKSDCSEYS